MDRFAPPHRIQSAHPRAQRQSTCHKSPQVKPTSAEAQVQAGVRHRLAVVLHTQLQHLRTQGSVVEGARWEEGAGVGWCMLEVQAQRVTASRPWAQTTWRA